VSTPNDPTPTSSDATGQYGLTPVRTWVGPLVNAGQIILRDQSRYHHAYVITDADAGIAVEARPGGAGYVNYRDAWPDSAFSHVEMTDEQRARIVAAAETVVGRGYGWLDYLALACHQYGFRPAWLERYVARTDRLICSQLVDEIYREAGIHLFADGRQPGDVTPGDLTYVGNVH
jgi:uncharacterized protein YycO